MNDTSIEIQMTAILMSMFAGILALVQIQTPSIHDNNSNDNNNDIHNKKSRMRLLPCPITQPSKRTYEIYALHYTPIWIAVFAVVVLFEVYEKLDAWGYDVLCVSLALPFLCHPFTTSLDRPIIERYSFKANVWLLIYSFIGNYWYTHYFYSVLKAKYTMPAHRLNDVPIALYFATHFYFSTYHVFSNVLLRWVDSSYEKGVRKTLLFGAVVICFSYFTAFMETLTISSYPYYFFEDRNMAYTVGSAFYGIYFLVSFPAFYYFDNDVDSKEGGKRGMTLYETVVSSCGAGMIILCLLDFVRLYLGVQLVIGSNDE